MSAGVVTVVGTTTNMASVRAMGVSMASVESGGALNAIFNIPKASDSTLGGVKVPIGGDIEIDENGNISINEELVFNKIVDDLLAEIPNGNEVSY